MDAMHMAGILFCFALNQGEISVSGERETYAAVKRAEKAHFSLFQQRILFDVGSEGFGVGFQQLSPL